MMSDELMIDGEPKQFRVEWKQAGLKINPATAEIYWEWGCGLDAYGINPDLAEEARCIGREYFARAPERDYGWGFVSRSPLSNSVGASRKARSATD